MWGSTYGLALVAAAFIGGLIAFGFVIGTPILGVPLAAVGVAVIGAVVFARRRKEMTDLREFREGAAADEVEFTERDRQTLLHD
jgi:hypothetical protein